MSVQVPPSPPPPPATWPGPPPVAPRRRRTRLLVAVGVALAVVIALGVTVVWLSMRGNDPEDVARDYIEARYTYDLETTCDLVSEENQRAMLDEAEASDCEEYADQMRDQQPPEFGEVLDDLDVDVRIGEVVDEEEGYVQDDGVVRPEENDPDAVEVEWGVLRRYTGDDVSTAEKVLGEDGLVEAEDDELDLVREHGDWRVDNHYAADTGAG